MTPIGPRRAAWLRVVHRLSVEFRRPPISREIALATGRDRSSVTQMVSRAVKEGNLETARPSAFAPAPIRLTPRALIALELPMVVYLAWPGFDPERGAEISSWLGDLGVWVISPYLGHRTIAAGREADLAAAAMSLASRSDAVVCWADPMILGRPDVAAAHAGGVPISLVRTVDAALLLTRAALWSPPMLVPHIPQAAK